MNCIPLDVSYVFESAQGVRSDWTAHGFIKTTEAMIVLTLETATDEIPTGTQQLAELLREFEHYFGVEFSIWDGVTGELVHGSRSQPAEDHLATASLISARTPSSATWATSSA